MFKLLIILAGWWLSLSCWASPFPDRWDNEFRTAVRVYLPGLDYRLLKAQCYQESLLVPTAVSPVGAYGLCQFMPGTAQEVGSALGVEPEAFWLPKISITAAAFYMARLHRTWSTPRPFMDRHMLALASYNAGAGHLIKAQRICDMAVYYRAIIPCLPKVTGRHAEETRTYVERIMARWWPRMLIGG